MQNLESSQSDDDAAKIALVEQLAHDLWEMIVDRTNDSHQIETVISLVLTQMAIRAPEPRQYAMTLGQRIAWFILTTLRENDVRLLPH
jgi:hypothetical protein